MDRNTNDSTPRGNKLPSQSSRKEKRRSNRNRSSKGTHVEEERIIKKSESFHERNDRPSYAKIFSNDSGSISITNGSNNGSVSSSWDAGNDDNLQFTESGFVSNSGDEYIKENNGGEQKYRRYCRNGVENDEDPEYKFFKKLEIIRNKHKRKWDDQKWGHEPQTTRRGTKNHYTVWRNAYDSYLIEMFDRVGGRIKKFKNCKDIKLDFEDFADFSYEFSSGYITPYA